MRKSFTICVHNETQGFEVVFKPGFGCTFPGGADAARYP